VFLNELNPTNLGLLVQFHISAKDWTAEQATKEPIFLAILTLVQELKIRLTATPQEIKVLPPVSSDEIRVIPTSDGAVEIARKMPVGWIRDNS
jgi:hypothetical protein